MKKIKSLSLSVYLVDLLLTPCDFWFTSFIFSHHSFFTHLFISYICISIVLGDTFKKIQDTNLLENCLLSYLGASV